MNHSAIFPVAPAGNSVRTTNMPFCCLFRPSKSINGFPSVVRMVRCFEGSSGATSRHCPVTIGVGSGSPLISVMLSAGDMGNRPYCPSIM